MVALATTDDWQVRSGVADADLDRVEALLEDASASVRIYTGQQFTLGETTDRLKVTHGRVRLPQRPVVEVTTVVDLNGVAVAYTLVNDLLLLNPVVPDAWAWEPRTTPLLYVDVTYTHGYDEIPDVIVAIVCQIAGRAYGVKPDMAAVTQESIAGYSYQLGSAGGAGPVGLLPDERTALDRFRRNLGSAAFAL